jgi:hypothetical protein
MGTEKCPFCGQEIDAAAKRCFYCGAELNEESIHKRLEQLHMQDKQNARRIHKPLLIKIIVILILAGIVFFYGTSGRKHISGIDSTAQGLTVILNAKVTFPGTRFIISNNDSFDWKSVKLQIIPESMTESFSLNIPVILSGETYTADASKFLNNEGIRFNPDKMKSLKFRILCDTPTRGSGLYLADWK